MATSADYSFGTGDVGTTHAEAMQALFAAKERKLHHVIHGLQKRVEALQATQHEHKRAQYITALQAQAKERELALDVLKEELKRRCSLTDEEVAAILVRKTIGSPRMRPKTREELTMDIAALEQKILAAGRAVDKAELKAAQEKRLREEAEAGKLKFAAAVQQSEAALAAEKAGRASGLAESSAVKDLQQQLSALSDLESKSRKLMSKYTHALDELGQLRQVLVQERRQHEQEVQELMAQLHGLGNSKIGGMTS